jgi:flagellar biosynthesis protein FliR
VSDANASLLAALARCLTFVATAPPLSMRSVPASVRAALALTLSPIVAAHGAHCCTHTSLGAYAIYQALAGAAMGLSVQAVAGAAEAAGALIDSAISQPPIGFDRSLSASTGPIARIYSLAFALVFLSAGGFTKLVQALASQLAVDATLPTVSTVAAAARVCFVAAASMAWPLLSASCLATVAAGVLGRLSPRINVMFLAAPFATSLGLVTLVAAAPALLRHLEALAVAAVDRTQR